jgi:uncharacterized cupredoxin-like copper-binding protein
MTIRLQIYAAVILVLVAGLAACGGPSTAELAMSMSEFSFSPASATVPAGAEVTLTLTNGGTIEHNWVLLDAGYQAAAPFDADDQANVLAETKVAASQVQTFTFTAPADAGSLQIVCSIPGHLEAGMAASLTVDG